MRRGVFSGREREGSAVVVGEETGNRALAPSGRPFKLLALDWVHRVGQPGRKLNPRQPRPGFRAAGSEVGGGGEGTVRDGAGLACAREGSGPRASGPRWGRSGTRSSSRHFRQGSGHFGFAKTETANISKTAREGSVWPAGEPAPWGRGRAPGLGQGLLHVPAWSDICPPTPSGPAVREPRGKGAARAGDWGCHPTGPALQRRSGPSPASPHSVRLEEGVPSPPLGRRREGGCEGQRGRLAGGGRGARGAWSGRRSLATEQSRVRRAGCGCGGAACSRNGRAPGALYGSKAEWGPDSGADQAPRASRRIWGVLGLRDAVGARSYLWCPGFSVFLRATHLSECWGCVAGPAV